MKRYSFIPGIMVAILSLLALPAIAQESSPSIDTQSVTPVSIETTSVADETNDQSPIENNMQECIPGDPCDTSSDIVITEGDIQASNFGLWWQGLKENVSLAFTFDPSKKAEKRLRFAEKRMRIAEAMIERAHDNPKLKDRALKMAERADRLMKKVEKDRGKWVKRAEKVAPELIKNVGKNVNLRERLLDKIEQKMRESSVNDSDQEKALERFMELREKSSVSGKRLINAMENENLPEEIRAHLEKVKERIELHAEDVKEFRKKRKELLEQAKEGNDEAREKLKEIRQERKERLNERRLRLRNQKEMMDDAEEMMDDVKDDAEEMMDDTKEMMDDVKDEAEEMMDDTKEMMDDVKDEAEDSINTEHEAASNSIRNMR